MRRKRISTGLSLRYAVLVRDEFTCQYCGRHAPNVELQVDHVTPVSAGGTNAIDNLVAACRECNQGKKDFWDPGHILIRRPILEELQRQYMAAICRIADLEDALA